MSQVWLQKETLVKEEDDVAKAEAEAEAELKIWEGLQKEEENYEKRAVLAEKEASELQKKAARLIRIRDPPTASLK